ncbi:PREDICTED: ATP-binding cassette sub-family A member 3-like [Amphimedon queenslandica]|uniref:ABC transporter domain-containing protein n=1 Tax=Amphimedon queenslandica TaxID=400682 RepID=A0AAN0J5T6_AMPQE|nr:PREDICTED: ATP-binding cassette sub-family A member 3-like [Amphimedon queenslandica]|eukprot:XP_019852385.1 PREDICTED: ATP-binding cassette sub-family A member 3-like [Amphimedon queenslandica]
MWLLRKIVLFLLVLKKDFILQFRRPFISVVELSLPAVIILGIVLLRNFLPLFRVREQCFITFEADQLSVPFTGPYNIYYTPNDTKTNEIARIIQSRLPGSTLTGFRTENEIIRLIMNTENLDKRERGCFYNGAAIVFNNISDTDVSYTLRLRHETPTLNPRLNRWFTTLRAPIADPSGPRVYDSPYFNEGFLHLQHIVSQSLLQNFTGSWPNLPALEMRQFPHKSFDEDQFLPNVEFILPLCLMVSFFISVGLFTKELVLEKESRLRESLKMNGLSNGMLWTTWFIKQFLFLLVPVVLVTILFKYGNIFPNSNFGTLLIFMMAYLVSLLSFSFFISVWFDNSQVGMMAAFVFWFLTVIPHLFYNDIHNSTLKLLGCIFPNTCMGLGVSTIALLEMSGEGFQFIDFTRPLNSEDPINMHYVTGLLLLDSVLFMIVSWYMNEWRPGQYGIPRRFYFPFEVSYWTGKKSQNCCTSKGSVCPSQHSQLEEDVEGKADGSNDGSSTHEEISDLEAGIDIKGLVKKFKAKEYSRTEITAVDNLYFKVYKGQITALLGHNGAGKTTTMSILTGLFPPNSGSAYIKGLSIVNDIDLIRRNLGICPQHNVLFDRLTVSEHLYFFARLRGVPGSSIKKAVSSIISDLHLEARKDYKANELSGGYKRKLCLAIALVGDPDILILDEPTSGMDHNSRLLTWQILEQKKEQNKTILISTHSLDDTEKATRLAIMVEGKLACSGSPAWLKKRYGVGYNLRIALNERAPRAQVDELIKRHIRGSEPVTIGAETQCLLPLDKIGKFADLFTELERFGTELGIVSFSIQENKMEDVFIKVGQGENKSWNAQVRLLSTTYSRSRVVPGHPPILPLSQSLNSIDLNTWAFQGTTPYSDGFSQSGASNYFPPPPVECDDNDSWLEEQDMSTTLDQPAGFPALDQSRISTSQLAVHRRSDVRSPPIAGMEVLKEEEEEEEEEEGKKGEEMVDGAVVLFIPVPADRPRNKRVMELAGGERTPVPLISRSRASSISNISTGSIIRPSIIQDLNLPVEEESDIETERKGIVRPFIRSVKGCLTRFNHATGKWLQQYRAILTKRAIHFKRFYIGAVCQLLPLFIIICSLVISETLVSQYHSDRSFHLTLEKASLTDNRTIFHAAFVNQSLPFEDLLGKFGTTDVLNYTRQIINIKENTNDNRNASRCCSYHYQILDKYCATLDKDELMSVCRDVEDFGYSQCLDRCLNCCNATRNRLPSCTNPRYQIIDSNYPYTPASEYCPVPPKVSLEDYSDPVGPLDDINTFVAEHLLSLQDSDPSFYRTVLGGFTVSSRAPTHSVCGCEETEGVCTSSLKKVEFLNSVPLRQNCSNILSIPYFCSDNETFLGITLQSDFSQILEYTIQQSSLSIDNNTDNDICEMYPATGGSPLLQATDCISIINGLNSSGCITINNNPLSTVCVDISCSDCSVSSSISSQYGHCNTWKDEENYEPVITLWYNNQAYHLSPSLLNTLHNLYLHSSGYGNKSINVHNHPLPRHPSSTLDTASIDIITFAVGILSMFGYCFLLASMSLFIVQEKSSMAKHLQLSSGLRLSAYWLANFTWDLITCLLPVSFTIVIFAVGQIWVEQYSGYTLAAVASIFVMVCWAQIPAIYLLSLPFKDIYTAYTSLFLILFILSFSSMSITYVIGPLSGYRDTEDILHYIFLINPSYGLATSLSDLYTNSVVRSVCTSSSTAYIICAQSEARYTDNPFRFSRPGVGAVLVYFFVEGILYFSLTLLVDHYNQIKQYILKRRGVTSQKMVEKAVEENRRLLKSRELQRNMSIWRRDAERVGGSSLALSQRFPSGPLLDGSAWRGISDAVQPPKSRGKVNEDDSVKKEKVFVNNLLQRGEVPKDCTVAIGRLSKYYNNSFLDQVKSAWKFEPLREAAVQDMNIALYERQCFGLLGYNGAGKSTTFKMLCGEISATTGTALIAGYDIRTQLRAVQRKIGYCPQFDALIETLTGRETLTLFARLRGIEEKRIKDEVSSLIDKIGLRDHADKQCWKYSGGNRRKLSTAIALLGNPPVILLDEPTSGMDIKTKRDFINTLSRIIKEENKTVIFSSHSMSECESLCNRIGIMINGEFRVIGSTEKLRSKYGDNSTKLTIRVEHCAASELEQDEDEYSMEESTTVINNHFLQVPQPSPMPLRRAFPQPQNLNRRLSIVSQAPLHQPRRPTIRTYSRLKSIGKVAREFLPFQGAPTAQREGTDGAVDESPDEEISDNPYLRHVCLKIRQYFRGKEDITLISAEKDEVTYKLPKYDVPLSEIFQLIQLLKSDPSCHITSYSVSQSTLEQVYSHFIREQEEQEMKKKQTKEEM